MKAIRENINYLRAYPVSTVQCDGSLLLSSTQASPAELRCLRLRAQCSRLWVERLGAYGLGYDVGLPMETESTAWQQCFYMCGGHYSRFFGFLCYWCRVAALRLWIRGNPLRVQGPK